MPTFFIKMNVELLLKKLTNSQIKILGDDILNKNKRMIKINIKIKILFLIDGE